MVKYNPPADPADSLSRGEIHPAAGPAVPRRYEKFDASADPPKIA
jgi:hypothetical protein